MLKHCAEHVPYYEPLLRARSLDPASHDFWAGFRSLPFLDREIVQHRRVDLLARNIDPARRVYQSTGGTSGEPLSFYAEKGVVSGREWAFMHTQWRRVGYRLGARVALLRNHVLPRGQLAEWNPRTVQLVLDPFQLTPATAGQYLGALREHHIEFLHTYPSAAATLVGFAREAGLDTRLCARPGARADARGGVRAILASSENVYPGQREYLEGATGARLFSWYGHSEQLVLAGECEHGADYHVFPEYGLVELIDERGEVITEPGRRGEIVGTSFANRVMPFLRYRTGDSAEYAERSCACGRAYPRLREVRGRWLQEMVQRADGALVSMTALNMHSDVFERVRRFQLVQEEKGRLELLVVRGEGYRETDTDAIRRELLKKLGAFELSLRFVDDLPRTARGKHRYVVQKLTLPSWVGEPAQHGAAR